MDPQAISALVTGVAQAVQTASSPSSPGWKTSEFWLHILSLIPVGLAAAVGASNPITLGVAAAVTLGSSIYSICRSNVKVNALQVASQAAQAAASAIVSATPAPAPSAAPAGK